MKADKIIGAVQGVTKKWAKQRKREERDAAAAMNRRYVMTRRRSVSIRDAAFAIMEQAYLKASANGRLPAHARQIMYAARPYIQCPSSEWMGQVRRLSNGGSGSSWEAKRLGADGPSVAFGSSGL
jgi:hypothetical protein